MWARLSRDAEHGLSGERAADHEPEHPRRATSACRGHRVTRRREQGTGRDSEQEALGRGRAAYFRRDGLGVGVEGLDVVNMEHVAYADELPRMIAQYAQDTHGKRLDR